MANIHSILFQIFLNITVLYNKKSPLFILLKNIYCYIDSAKSCVKFAQKFAIRIRMRICILIIMIHIYSCNLCMYIVYCIWVMYDNSSQYRYQARSQPSQFHKQISTLHCRQCFMIHCINYDHFENSLKIQNSKNDHLILSKLVLRCLQYFYPGFVSFKCGARRPF